MIGDVYCGGREKRGCRDGCKGGNVETNSGGVVGR